MRLRILAGAVAAATVLTVGCNATSRHKVLTFFFDGVPPVRSVEDGAPGPTVLPEGAVRAAQAGPREHGPFAAKLCGACHDAGARNALVAPAGELCGRCHEVALDKAFVHGPVASGDCQACHEPHSSRYRSLLVSDTDGFCLDCHDRGGLPADADHGGVEAKCTVCHDAHMSDRKYLLKADRG